MTAFAVILALIFFCVCSFLATLNARATGMRLIQWATLGCGAIYGVAWAVVIYLTEVGENEFWAYWLPTSNGSYVLHTLAATVLVAAAWFGWAIGSRMSRRAVDLRRIDRTASDKAVAKSLWLLNGVALVCTLLYSSAYGGLVSALDYSVAIRSGFFEVNNAYSFLRPFGGLSDFASFGFFGLMICGHRRLPVKVGFCFAVSLSVYGHYSSLGRVDFVVYLVTFGLGYLIYKRIRSTLLLISVCAGAILLLYGIYLLNFLFEMKEIEGVGKYLAQELSFPFANFFAQLGAEQHLFRGFIDFVVAPIYLLPSSLWVGSVDEVSRVNTTLIMGAPKGEAGVTGGIPVDLLTLGLMQYHFFGIAGVGVLFGLFLRVFDRLLRGLNHPGLKAVFTAYVAIKVAVLSVAYSQPAVVLAGNIDLFVSLVVILLAQRPLLQISVNRQQHI